MRPSVAIGVLLVALVFGSIGGVPAIAAPKNTSVEGAAAADPSVQRRPRRITRIEVYPLSRYYRQCVDWYAVEPRPSGPVVTPHMRCRWALR